jgi:hypothetical protein
MARAMHVSAAPHRLDREVWAGEIDRLGIPDRHWFVPITPRGHFCLVCGGRKSDATRHRPKPKSKKPVS